MLLVAGRSRITSTLDYPLLSKIIPTNLKELNGLKGLNHLNCLNKNITPKLVSLQKKVIKGNGFYGIKGLNAVNALNDLKDFNYLHDLNDL